MARPLELDDGIVACLIRSGLILPEQEQEYLSYLEKTTTTA